MPFADIVFFVTFASQPSGVPSPESLHTITKLPSPNNRDPEVTKIVLLMNEIASFSTIHIFSTLNLARTAFFCGQQMLLIRDMSYLREISLPYSNLLLTLRC
jgi:hypothetical protein